MKTSVLFMILILLSIYSFGQDEDKKEEEKDKKEIVKPLDMYLLRGLCLLEPSGESKKETCGDTDHGIETYYFVFAIIKEGESPLVITSFWLFPLEKTTCNSTQELDDFKKCLYELYYEKLYDMCLESSRSEPFKIELDIYTIGGNLGLSSQERTRNSYKKLGQTKADVFTEPKFSFFDDEDCDCNGKKNN